MLDLSSAQNRHRSPVRKPVCGPVAAHLPSGGDGPGRLTLRLDCGKSIPGDDRMRAGQRDGLAARCAASLLLALAAGCGPGGDAGGAAAPAAASAGVQPGREAPVVLFLGDSLTAGYGLPAEQAFPALVHQGAEPAGFDYRVVNAGVSGDASAGGRRRISWLLRQPVAVLVLELGGNDMLRGQSVDRLRENLRAIIDATRAAHPEVRVVLAGMRAAPNLGRRYVEAFEATFPALAAETGAALIPFLLEGVAADPELNQADGIHPTAAGQRIVADTVWRTLEPILRAAPPRG